jgi:hypothetical protein
LSLTIDSAASQAATGALNIGASGALNLGSAATVNQNGSVALSGGVLNIPAGAALNLAVGGQLSGFGQVVNPGGLSNAGTIVASGGTLELSAGAGAMSIAPGGALNLDAGLAFGAAVNFRAAGLLALGNPTVTGGTISGFGGGDTISLAGISVTGSSYANGVLTLTEASGAVTLNVTGNFAIANLGVTNGAGGAQISLPGTGLLGNLNVNQQLELIYVAYFNRAADGGGFGFWGGQNTQAQNGGQSAALALTNIANSFTPQSETLALYPFLGTPNLDLTTPAGQAGLTTFINSLYGNLFGHAPDTPGLNYWMGQLTSGVVGLGAAALAIANGATGTDAIEVRNKIAVALDFTTRTNAAGLGQTAPLPTSFLTAAKTVLSGVDGLSLNDASVTAGMSATAAFLSTGQLIITNTDPIALGMSGSALATVAANDPIAIATSNSVIDPGVGNYTIQFLAGTSGDTLVLHAGGVDQVSGFDPGSDVLDLRALLAQAKVDLNGDVAALSNYLTVADQGSDVRVGFDPTGHGGGGTVAVLQGLGGVVTGLDTLVARGAIRIG